MMSQPRADLIVIGYILLLLGAGLVVGGAALSSRYWALRPPSQGGVGDWISMSNQTVIVEEAIKLRNTLSRRVTDYVYVVLPANTTFQKSFVLVLSPEPENFRVDEDGNIFAVFKIDLEPGGSAWINATFRVEKSEYKVLWDAAAPRWPPLSMVKTLTQPTAIWNTGNSTFLAISESLGNQASPLETAIGIASWVKSHLEYVVLGYRLGSDHAITRVGGRLVVRGDCVEAADVFVTLARIKGLPSRTVFGFLLTSPKERMWLNMSEGEGGMSLLEHWGGHMWPQVYIEPVGWVDVEMLEGDAVKVGDYSWRHIILGVEESRYYGTTLSNMCITGYLTLDYIEVRFNAEG